MKNITITNEDNMQLMARYEDNHFDLAIVDPPYGIVNKTFANKGAPELMDMKKWDKVPNKIYFNELFRVSKNQIVCGGNYFNLPHSRGWIVWDKMQFVSTYAPFELFWTSFNNVGKILKYQYSGNYIGFEGKITLSSSNPVNKKIHPTQKPIQLYEWLLMNYAKEGDKILDTHLGSGSIAIAVDNMNKIDKMNLTLTACELDKEYFDKSMERIKTQTAQQTLF